MALPQSKPQQLAELNQRSAPLASFDIVIHHPRIEDYEYSTKTGEKKNGASFRCLLVSKDNRDQYLAAESPMRGANRAPIQQALEKFKPGLTFRMNKTRLKGVIKAYRAVRRMAMTVVALQVAANIIDYYITKYTAKPMEQLQNLVIFSCLIF